MPLRDRALLEKYEFTVSILRKGDENENSVKVLIDDKLPYNKVFHPKLLYALIEAIKRTEKEVEDRKNE